MKFPCKLHLRMKPHAGSWTWWVMSFRRYPDSCYTPQVTEGVRHNCSKLSSIPWASALRKYPTGLLLHICQKYTDVERMSAHSPRVTQNGEAKRAEQAAEARRLSASGVHSAGVLPCPRWATRKSAMVWAGIMTSHYRSSRFAAGRLSASLQL